MSNAIKGTILILTAVLILFSVLPYRIVFAGDTTASRIVGYAGNLSDNYLNVDYTKLTHVMYGTVGVTSATDPTLVDEMGTGYKLLTKIRDKSKSINPNIKVMAILGGGSWQGWDQGHLTAILSNPNYRNQLAVNLASLVSAFSLDGIDIDWEGSDISQANYHSFLVVLRNVLPSGKLISVCGPGAIVYQPATDYKYWFNAVNDSAYIDMYNVMSYGFSYNDFVNYTNMWLSAGFPAGKLNFGYSTIEDNISLVSSKAQWALSQGVVGQLIWTVDSDVNGSAKNILNTVYNTIYSLSVTTSVLVTGTTGAAYSQTLTATGGTTPYTWSIVSGTLPAGLALTSVGIISGSPTTAVGPTPITFKVTDSSNTIATKSLIIGVNYATYDVNKDGDINVLDMTIISQHWGETGTSGWIPPDVNNDGIINSLDMIIVGQHWTP